MTQGWFAGPARGNLMGSALLLIAVLAVAPAPEVSEGHAALSAEKKTIDDVVGLLRLYPLCVQKEALELADSDATATEVAITAVAECQLAKSVARGAAINAITKHNEGKTGLNRLPVSMVDEVLDRVEDGIRDQAIAAVVKHRAERRRSKPTKPAPSPSQNL